MCLSVPAKIIEINNDMAKASVGGSIIDVGLQLVEDVKLGDYVLVHTGFALEKVNEDEAIKMLEMIKQLTDNPDDVT
ncbi:MAG: HypC/HybG/HupF family hydrogenase formation chaperone [Bacteroidales bacterium]|nr:HypC/HybG/HupF family hydrogenase formation chaperone [Bacteroidales bacterium]MBN2818982.1 HypC/HybG/HupF family hydrogenase formation chaperone [Bacteroidales bacterium]